MVMKNVRFALAFVIVGSIACVALDRGVAFAADTKSNNTALERLTTDVQFLASDELEGRGPGTAGLVKARDYVRDEFQRLGLKGGAADGSYFQPFEISLGESAVSEKSRLVLNGPDGKCLTLEIEKAYRPFFSGGTATVNAPVVFVGYGITAPDLGYDDYRDLDVEGKVVLLIRREPQQDNESSKFDGRRVTMHSYVISKLKAAFDHKAAAVLMVNDPFSVKSGGDALMPAQGAGLRNANMPFGHIRLDVADQLLAAAPLTAGDAKLSSIAEVESHIDARFAPVSQPLEGWTADIEFAFDRKDVQLENVVGVLEGEGPLANETLVIGAHYDHLGYGGFGSRKAGSTEIHNGADDNASGTAAMLELARNFAGRATKPARRIVFIGFSAEERGLLGSNHYVNHPLFPLEDTVAMLNFDMIGNLRENRLELHGTSSGKEFDSIADEVAKQVSVEIKKTGAVMAASDHFGFYQKKVPVTFFFTGLTDLYHTPEDDVATLNLAGIETVVRYTSEFAWLVANREARIEFAEAPAGRRPNIPGRGLGSIGVTPDYSANDGGVKLSAVRDGSPAAAAGLKAGDVIVKIGEVAVTNVETMAEGLRKASPGEPVKVVVKRGETEVELAITRPASSGSN